jgi:serine/threonine protein kinase
VICNADFFHRIVPLHFSLLSLSRPPLLAYLLSPSSSLLLTTVWDIDPHGYFLTAKIDFLFEKGSEEEGKVKEAVEEVKRGGKVEIAFFYIPLPLSSSSPPLLPILNCPRPLLLEYLSTVESRQLLTRRGVVGKGNHGKVWKVETGNGVYGALKEISLPYSLHRASLEHEILLHASFSTTFHTEDRNPFGNAYNMGLEHLVRPPRPSSRPLSLPLHEHLCVLHSAFLDPVSHRVYHLMEWCEGSSLEEGVERWRGEKEVGRKEEERRKRKEEDGRERREDEERKQRRMRSRLVSDPLLGSSSDSDSDLDSEFTPLGFSPRPLSSSRTSHIPSPWLRSWALQFCLALRSLKAHGIVHADIAARNVWFKDRAYSRLVIGDFGMARRVEVMKGGKKIGEEESPRETPRAFLRSASTTAPLLLPFRSLSPELLTSRRDSLPLPVPSYSSDLWCCGAILLRCMTLPGNSGEEEAKQTQEWAEMTERELDDWISHERHSLSYPSSMWSAVRGMLRVNPLQRFTAEQALQAWIKVEVPSIERELAPGQVAGFQENADAQGETEQVGLKSNNPASSLFSSLSHLSSLYAAHTSSHLAQEARLKSTAPSLNLAALGIPERPDVLGGRREEEEQGEGRRRKGDGILTAPSQTKPHHLPTRDSAYIEMEVQSSRIGGSETKALGIGRSSSGLEHSARQAGATRPAITVAPVRNSPSSNRPLRSSVYEFDTHPARWRYIFAFLDTFLPSSLKSLRVATLHSGNSREFFEIPKTLFLARFCVAFTLIQLLVGLWGILFAMGRKEDPRLDEEERRRRGGVDWIAIGGIFIFETYCILFLLWLKYKSHCLSLHPWIGNGTIFQEIMILCYATYQTSGVGLSFYLVLFSIPTLSFMLVNYRSAFLWQVLCFLLLLTINILWRVAPGLSYENLPSLQQEHDILLPVGIFLLIFPLLSSLLFHRYTSIVHFHLDLALEQVEKQEEYMRRMGRRKGRWVEEMTKKVERPMREMMEALDGVLHPASLSSDSVLENMQKLEKRKSKRKRKLTNEVLSLLPPPLSSSLSLSLSHTRHLTLSYLHSLHVQSLIRDMIDLSLVENYQYVVEQGKEAGERGEGNTSPLDVSSSANSLFPFHLAPFDFAKLLESTVKNLSLVIARRPQGEETVISAASLGLPNFASPPPSSLQREVVFHLSPTLYRDARYIGDSARVTRLLRTMVRIALEWGEGNETVTITAHPRSFGSLHSGSPYAFLELSIAFTPNYRELGKVILPAQFGLWSFQHPADEINLAIIQRMNGRVWMSGLELRSPLDTAMGVREQRSTKRASINLILMFQLTHAYNIPPSAAFGSVQHPVSPTGSPDVSQCAPPSSSGVASQASVAQLAMFSSAPSVSLSGIGLASSQHYSSVHALVVDAHPDASANLMHRLLLFGVRAAAAMEAKEALAYLHEFKNASLDGGDVEPVAVALQKHSTNASAENKIVPGIVEAERIWSTSPSATRNAARHNASSLISPDATVRCPSSSLILFLNQRLPMKSGSAMGGVEFILQLIDAHPHWLTTFTPLAPLLADIPSIDHVLTFHDRDGGLRSVKSASSVASNSQGAGSAVSALLPCPHLVLMLSWSPLGSVVDGVECAQMEMLSRLPLVRPIRFLSKPVTEQELYECISAMKLSAGMNSPS